MQLGASMLRVVLVCQVTSLSVASEAGPLLDAVADQPTRALLSRAFEEIETLKATVESLRREQQGDGARRLQRTGATDQQAREVHIYTRSMTRETADGSGARGAGRRQAQAAPGLQEGCWTQQGGQGNIDVEGRTAAVHAACCSRVGDDCSSGAPATCDAECAAELLQFWDDCGVHLRVDKALWTIFHNIVQECQEADVSRAGESLCVLLLVPLATRPPTQLIRIRCCEHAGRCNSR